ncbi:MAG: SDR family oxidoreductase [Methylococcaceae bacterium]|nr:SDR family oxidoreductase [Methylococcaceae bacterium]
MNLNIVNPYIFDRQETWLITGVAGFIGSNLLEFLLQNDQKVIGLDNFSTGRQDNLDSVRAIVGAQQCANFTLIEGDIRDFNLCVRACADVDYVLHHAALVSVPISVEEPFTANSINIDGFLNMLTAAKDAKVNRFVYASSSAVYGNDEYLPKVEDCIDKPLSPYALTKYVNELYADLFTREYGTATVGLRYFNIFGPRQDPNGAYAAVIPKWIASMCQGEPVYINGDGESTRDFCYIGNVVQANILAATTGNPAAIGQVFNIGSGMQMSLNQLFGYLKINLQDRFQHLGELKPSYRDFRAGDVRHSVADISKAQRLLGFNPCPMDPGFAVTSEWYLKQ